MKMVLLFLLMTFCKTGQSQLKVGMSLKTIMPSTVTANSSYSVVVWIKNKGTTSYTGKIHLKYGVDSTQTLNHIILTKTDSVSVSNFAPGDSVLKSISETYKIQNAYRYGNGSTVVLWPYIKTDSTATKDSLKRVVYVIAPTINSLEESSYLNTLKLFPNPTNNDIVYLNITEMINPPETIIFYSIYGTYITEIPFNETIDISMFSSGIYVLEFLSKNRDESKRTKLVIN